MHRTTEHVLSDEYLTAFSALDEESQIIKEVRLTGGAQIRDTRCSRKSIAFITGTGILIAVEGAIYIISKSTFEGRQERRRTTSTGLLTRQTRWEVVFVSSAATKNELFAFAGGRVEKPTRDYCQTNTGFRRQKTYGIWMSTTKGEIKAKAAKLYSEKWADPP